MGFFTYIASIAYDTIESTKKLIRPFVSVHAESDETYIHKGLDFLKESRILKNLFILTNGVYVYTAYLLYSGNHTAVPLTNFLSETVCKYPSFHYTSVLILGIVSTIYHYNQCYCCTRHNYKNCMWWNILDMGCARMVVVLSILCFAKSRIVLFIPCFGILLLGQYFLDKGNYTLYFLFHGIWHILTSLLIVYVCC